MDEARRLIGAGRIVPALGLLAAALRTAESEHGPDSPVASSLRRQYAALLPHADPSADPTPRLG